MVIASTYSEMVDEAHAEIAELKQRLDKAKFVVDGLRSEVDSAKRHREWVAAGSKGMHVPFHGDFAAVAMSGLLRLEWWLRELDSALTKDSSSTDATPNPDEAASAIGDTGSVPAGSSKKINLIDEIYRAALLGRMKAFAEAAQIAKDSRHDNLATILQNLSSDADRLIEQAAQRRS